MSRHRRTGRKPAAALWILPALLALACSDDDDGKDKAEDVAVVDTEADAGVVDSGVVDAGPTGFKVPAGKHVGAELGGFVGDTGGQGAFVRKFAASLKCTGPAAQARAGDWVIGNERVRFAIQGPDRRASVCPWGGNVIDAAFGGGGAAAADARTDDNLGEYCLFFNLGRTLKPEHFEVLRDGSKGGPAVLAVTGPDTLNDFLNLPSMLASFLGGADIDFPLDVEIDVPVTITRYYILAPNENVLRVVTSFRNDGKDKLILGTGELIDSGGKVEFFNPANNKKGFGYGGITPEPMDYLAFRGESSSHAFAPPPIGGKPGAGYLAVSGAAGIMLGADNVLSLLVGGPEKFAKHQAAIHLEPGKIASRMHLVAVGSGDLSTLSGPLWKARGATTAAVAGKVVDEDGKPVVGARISAVRDERARTQFLTDENGEFSGALPYKAGAKWSFEGYMPGRWLKTAGKLTMPAAAPGSPLTVDVTFTATAKLVVDVVGSAGKPTPAKLTVYCDPKCPARPTTHFDTGLRSPGGGAYLAEFVGIDGHLELPVAPGKYKVIVTGGPTRSLWPADGKPHAIEVAAGKTATVKATIRDAVDTSGWLCGEFHIHQINSPDAPVLNRERVRSFLAEGVDVLVPTDHDYITDMKP